MYPISARQIKAARQLLDWSQDDLAQAAHVSRSTINSVEKGSAIRANNVDEIYKTLEKNGIEFLADNGVKLHPNDLRDFKGPDSCDRFFDEVIETIRQRGGDLICIIQSLDILTKVSGATRRTNLQRLDEIQKITTVKCLVTDRAKPSFVMPSFEIRVLPEEPGIVPMSSFAYGNQWVGGYRDSQMNFAFAAFQQTSFMHSCQNYFLPRWHIARPLLMLVRA